MIGRLATASRVLIRLRWTSYMLATAAVLGALLLRLVLESVGHVYYLPLVLAVMAPALLADRRATALAIALSIVANVFLVPRESVTDVVVNALLFAAVGVMIGELGQARRELKRRSADLAGKLHSQDALMQAMLQSVPVITLGEADIVRYISGTACRLFETSQAQAVGRPFTDFVEAFDIEAVRLPGDGGASRGAGGFWTGRRPGGETFPLDIQIGRVGDGTGEHQAVLCLADLTHWQASEARNQDLAVQLNHVWRLHSLGEMGAILSHELNQPLAAATTYLHASQSDLDRVGVMGASANRTIDLAKNQILRAGKIIRRMRDLMTVEGEALKPERVSSMLDDLGPMIALLGSDAGIRVRVGIDDRFDHVLADRTQFQQAIVNLIRNAVEAVETREGGPWREVMVLGNLSLDGRYHVSVEDSGPGIAADQVERIFQPLTTTKSNGMGLGLSVTRSIVERHGGALVVGRSDLGGAAFRFSLTRDPEGSPTSRGAPITQDT